VPSPLYHDGLLYLVSDGGTATCFEADGGKQVWQERLAGAFTSSPVLAGGRVYVTSGAGKTPLFQAGPKVKRVATNHLGAPGRGLRPAGGGAGVGAVSSGRVLPAHPAPRSDAPHGPGGGRGGVHRPGPRPGRLPGQPGRPGRRRAVLRPRKG